MPVQRFFALRNAARRLEAADRAEFVKIAATPAYTKEYSETLSAGYLAYARNENQEPEYLSPGEAKEILGSMFGR